MEEVNMFVGRDNELKLLESYFKMDHSLLIILGKKRCGKTTLIQNFLSNKNSFYFLPTAFDEQINIISFVDQLSLSYKIAPQVPVRTWNDAFSLYIEHIDDSHKNVLVIDEFSNLISENKKFLSTFKEIWTKMLCKHKIQVILCGSNVRLMKDCTSARSPIEDIVIDTIQVNELSFLDSCKLMSAKSFKDQVRLYSITGGIPLYLNIANKREIRAFVEDEFFTPSGYFYREKRQILSDNIGSRDSAVLTAVGRGETVATAIANSLNIKEHLIKYSLANLERHLLIKKNISLVLKGDSKSNKFLYSIDNNFLNFYYNFMYPYLSELDRGLKKNALEHFDTVFEYQYQGMVFESICQQLFEDTVSSGQFEWTASTLGGYWNNSNSIEIDVVSKDNETYKVFLGECKFFKTKPVDMRIYHRLKEKAKFLNEKDIIYGLFSVTGFSDDIIRLAKSNNHLILFEKYEMLDLN